MKMLTAGFPQVEELSTWFLFIFFGVPCFTHKYKLFLYLGKTVSHETKNLILFQKTHGGLTGTEPLFPKLLIYIIFVSPTHHHIKR